MARPARLHFTRPDGRKITLDSGLQAFERLFLGDSGVLLLGLGPDTTDMCALPGVNDAHEPVFWVEHPNFPIQADNTTALRDKLPGHWRRIGPDEIEMVPADVSVFSYRQNMRLFPEFWGPILASVTIRKLGACRHARTRSVLLPGNAHSLLVQELETALKDEGYAVRRVAPALMLNKLSDLLAEERPELCLSVNLRGLDAEGRNFHLLRACGTALAIWIVDNPLHILSSMRENWWHEAHIFITDASFIPGLRATGAGKIFHLPLGAWMHPPSHVGKNARLAPLLFVGRTAFPRKNAFFAAARVPQMLLSHARNLLETSDLPDFHWWMRQLRAPGVRHDAALRAAGLGAEETSLARRVQWLRAALHHGLTVHGDERWRVLLPDLADLRPPVDYYGALPELYFQARFSLNVTSLLLPAGLTQRHFDVWSSGGFLLSDTTPGLDIFPAELCSEISLRHPSELTRLLRRLENEPALRSNLQEAWKTCLAEKHTYAHRIHSLLELLR